MSMVEDLISTLEANPTLLNYLTGGIYGDDVVEISRQATPAAFDANGEILPCLLVRQGNRAPDGPYEHSTRAFIDLFFYQRGSLDAIQPAQEWVYWLLHREKAGVSGAWEVRHVGDIPATEDPALSCNLMVSQYVVYWNRGEMPS